MQIPLMSDCRMSNERSGPPDWAGEQIDTMSRRPGRGQGGRGSQGQAAPDVNGNQPSTAPRARGRG